MDIRVAAYGVVVEGDRILLAHWNERGYSGWTLPGGGLEPGEHPEAAAIREIREETGYDAQLEGLIGIDSTVVPAERRPPGADADLHSIRILYRARIVGGELTYELDGSTDYAAWHPLASLGGLDRVSLIDAARRLAAFDWPED